MTQDGNSYSCVYPEISVFYEAKRRKPRASGREAGHNDNIEDESRGAVSGIYYYTIATDFTRRKAKLIFFRIIFTDYLYHWNI